jgi:hypothetical protein
MLLDPVTSERYENNTTLNNINPIQIKFYGKEYMARKAYRLLKFW